LLGKWFFGWVVTGVETLHRRGVRNAPFVQSNRKSVLNVCPCVINNNYEGCGTLFKVTPSGTFTVMHEFCQQTGCPDGENPGAAVQLWTDSSDLAGDASDGSGDRRPRVECEGTARLG